MPTFLHLIPRNRASLALLAAAMLAQLACSSAGGTGDATPNVDALRTAPDAAPNADALRTAPDAASACQRRVFEGAVTNARDLGSQPLADGAQVACRTVLRGGDLGSLSGAGCDELETLGIRTVVDLREAATQQSSPPAACVAARATVVSAPMPKLLPDTPEHYVALLDETAAVGQLFATLGDAHAGPTYLHCVIGRDRASFASALVLLALGASRQTVIDEFNLSAAAGVAVKQPCIEGLLDAIDARGGIVPYLHDSGVTDSQLTALRNRATAR